MKDIKMKSIHSEFIEPYYDEDEKECYVPFEIYLNEFVDRDDYHDFPMSHSFYLTEQDIDDTIEKLQQVKQVILEVKRNLELLK